MTVLVTPAHLPARPHRDPVARWALRVANLLALVVGLVTGHLLLAGVLGVALLTQALARRSRQSRRVGPVSRFGR